MGSISLYFSFVPLQVERFSHPSVVQMGPSYCHVLFSNQTMLDWGALKRTRKDFSYISAAIGHSCTGPLQRSQTPF